MKKPLNTKTNNTIMTTFHQPPPTTSPSVLIIDPNLDYRAMIHEIVHEAIESDYPTALVTEAENGTEACQRFARSTFDLLISDFDGEAIKMIEMIEHSIEARRILVHSAARFEAVGHFGLEKIAYLKKPCSLEALENAIRNSLGLTRALDTTETRFQSSVQPLHSCCRRIV